MKYPETGLSKLHNIPKGGSMTGDGECRFCWPNPSGTVDDIDCRSMTCAPALLLDIPDGLRFQSPSPLPNWDLSRPVVVSPDQDWVAYALEAKDCKGVELWVGRLKYNPDVLVR